MTDPDLSLKAVKTWAAANDRDVHGIAAALGVSYTSLWRYMTGERPWPATRAAEMRRLMEHAPPAERPTGPARKKHEEPVHWDVTRTPRGDGVLVAVGRFEAIQKMAAQLETMAGHSGKALSHAAASAHAAAVESSVRAAQQTAQERAGSRRSGGAPRAPRKSTG